MSDFDVVLSPEAREFLLELEPEERRRLVLAMLDELKLDAAPIANVKGRVLRRELYGYYVDYRDLQADEKRRFKVRSGKFIYGISLVTRRFWGWGR